MSELDRVLDELHADQRATAAVPDGGDGARAVGDADQGARPPVLSGAGDQPDPLDPDTGGPTSAR